MRKSEAPRNESNRKLGRELGSSPGSYPSLTALWKPPRAPPPCQGSWLFTVLGAHSVSRKRTWLGRWFFYRYTCKHTVYACLNKVTLKKGDLCQHTETNLHATVCSRMVSGKSWHIFLVQPHTHNGITFVGEMNCCGIKGCVGFF